MAIAPETTGSLLRQVLVGKINRNPSYSLRAMARQLGLSHTYLSLVIQGKKRLSRERAHQVIATLHLDGEIGNRLLNSVEASPDFDDTTEYQILEHDRFRIVSSWYHIALLDLMDVEGFRSNEAWMSRALGITRVQVAEALERLERVGLIARKGGKWRKCNTHVMVPTLNPNAAIREFHRQMIEKALESLLTDPNGFLTRDITGTTMAIDPSRLPEAKKRIAKFRKDLLRYLSGGKRTKLYQLNVQLFGLSKEVGEKD